jgi:hypothetical protein
MLKAKEQSPNSQSHRGPKNDSSKKTRESFKALKSFSFHSTKPQNHNQYHVPFPNTVTTRPSHQTSS